MFQIWGARRGNCTDHNSRYEYVVQSCPLSSLSAERSRKRKGTETIGEQMSQKYTGDRPWMQLYIIAQF